MKYFKKWFLVLSLGFITGVNSFLLGNVLLCQIHVPRAIVLPAGVSPHEQVKPSQQDQEDTENNGVNWGFPDTNITKSHLALPGSRDTGWLPYPRGICQLLRRRVCCGTCKKPQYYSQVSKPEPWRENQDVCFCPFLGQLGIKDLFESFLQPLNVTLLSLTLVDTF